MLRSIQKFFQTYIDPPHGATEVAVHDDHALNVATAALLMEIAQADFESNDNERSVVTALLQRHFDLSRQQAERLVVLGEQEVQEASSLFQFTSLVDKGFTLAEKVRIVEHLWRVAYADERLDKYEEHLVRKIADLLHLSHSQFIQAKHRVLDERIQR